MLDIARREDGGRTRAAGCTHVRAGGECPTTCGFVRGPVPVLIIRAGKTMPVTTTEVRIRFRPVPFDVFGVGRSRLTNTLKLWIWPDTEIGLALAGKKAGAGREPQLQDLVLPRTARRTCALRPPHRCRAERQPRTVRPPGHVKQPGASTRFWATSSPCTLTSAARAGRRRPTACCRTATTGTTRRGDPAGRKRGHRGR